MVPGSAACKGGVSLEKRSFRYFIDHRKLFFDSFTINGGIACNTLLTATVYLALKVDLEKYRLRLFWVFFAFVTLFPIGVSILSSSYW